MVLGGRCPQANGSVGRARSKAGLVRMPVHAVHTIVVSSQFLTGRQEMNETHTVEASSDLNSRVYWA